MKAIQIDQYGGEEQLELVDLPRPQAGPGQVVVRIMATSTRSAKYNKRGGIFVRGTSQERSFSPSVKRRNERRELKPSR
jgi:NADPH:quinone reductase-like Zn-dependent oxidoreductase